MTLLAAESILVRRADRAILDHVSLSANPGEFVALVGANGAGKSTLLSVLAGLNTADSGSVTLRGVPLSRYSGPDLARMRAFLPQNPRCEWPIAVERLVALGLTPTLPAFGGFAKLDEQRITRALEFADLVERRMQPATSLSGGELTRAMLARALVGDPDVIIVDEPTAGLDPKHAIAAMRLLKSLADGGKLVIAALHDLTLAARHATRIVALRQGCVEGDGPMDRTLTPTLIRRVFDVEARIINGETRAYVDYLGH